MLAGSLTPIPSAPAARQPAGQCLDALHRAVSLRHYHTRGLRAYTVSSNPVFLAAVPAHDRSPDHLQYPATRCVALAIKARKARIRLRPGVVGAKDTVSTISATRNNTKRQDIRAFDGSVSDYRSVAHSAGSKPGPAIPSPPMPLPTRHACPYSAHDRFVPYRNPFQALPRAQAYGHNNRPGPD